MIQHRATGLILLKRALFTVLCFVLVASSIPSTQAASGDQQRLSDLQKKINELNRQIKEDQQAAAGKKKEASALSSQISELDDNISVTESAIEETNRLIGEAESEIRGLETEIGARQQDLETEQRHQDETIRVLYETSVDDLLFMIVGSDSISDVIEHSEYLESLESQIETTIGQIETLKKELEAKKAMLETRRQELTSLKVQHEAYAVGLEGEKAQKDALLTQTKQEQKRLESKVTEAKKLNSQVESELASLRSRLTKSSGPGVTQARDRGTSSVGFQWPTDYRYISTYFGGSTPFQPGGGHGGLDLVNLAGTPIYAAADGTVTAVAEMRYNGEFYAYGRYLVVGHNARWSSLYAHLQSIVVGVGTEVKRGDVIGYMGSTGWSTGPHLHFEIWEYSSRVNPTNLLP